MLTFSRPLYTYHLTRRLSLASCQIRSLELEKVFMQSELDEVAEEMKSIAAKVDQEDTEVCVALRLHTCACRSAT